MNVILVGGGHMAAALLGGLFAAGRPKGDITVVEPDPRQRERLTTRFSPRFSAAQELDLHADDCVVWAVKPQHLKAAAALFSTDIARPLHISIAAGLRTALLAQWLGTERIVRAMPNSAAAVGCGVTGLFALDGVSQVEREFAADLFSLMGSVHWLSSDDRIDALTAVSGSGPAYVFHFLESLQAAAEDLGFDSETARSIILQTAHGALQQVLQGQESVAALRKQVTSAKGTTEAALAVLARRKASNALSAAVHEAYRRAGEIAKEWEKPG